MGSKATLPVIQSGVTAVIVCLPLILIPILAMQIKIIR